MPPGKVIHAILDNDATHKHPKVLARRSSPLGVPLHADLGVLAERREGFFSILTRRRLKRGVFKSTADLQHAIARYIRAHNKTPKPFVWRKPAKTIPAKLDRLPAPSASWRSSACPPPAIPTTWTWQARAETAGTTVNVAALAIAVLQLDATPPGRRPYLAVGG